MLYLTQKQEKNLFSNLKLTLTHNIFIKVDSIKELDVLEEACNELVTEYSGLGITFNDYRGKQTEYQKKRGLAIYELPMVLLFNDPKSQYLVTHEGSLKRYKDRGYEVNGTYWPDETYRDIYARAIDVETFINLEKFPEHLI